MIQKSRQCIAWPYFSSLTCPKFVVGLVIVHSWRLALNHYKTFLDKLNEHGGAFGYIVLNYHLITKQKMFKRPKNWIFWTQMMIFLKLILLWVQLLVFDKKCSDFMKKGSMNYSNIPWKLAKHRSVSPQNVYKSFTNGLQHKLTFIAMKTPNSDSLLGEAWKKNRQQINSKSWNRGSRVSTGERIRENQGEIERRKIEWTTGVLGNDMIK